MRAVIVSVMPGVCAVLAHVRGLSNLIGDTSCLSWAPRSLLFPRFVAREGGGKKKKGWRGGGGGREKKVLIPNLSPVSLSLCSPLCLSVSFCR